MPSVVWGFTETRSMRRHDKLRVVDARLGRRAASWRALAALGLLLTATGAVPWGGAVPGALASVSPNTGVISDGAESIASGGSNVILEVQPLDEPQSIPLM